MADYPSSVKTFPTLVDLIDSVLAEHQNERGDEITAIETELGTDPRGSSATVKDRLTMLELGWMPDSNTWSYSSVDGPTGVLSVAADMTAKLSRGMRIRFEQSHGLSAYWSFDASSTPDVGAFTCTDTNMSYTAGKFSNAATFNGSTSKIVITDAAGLRPAGPFTVGLWFKTAVGTGYQGLYQVHSMNPNLTGFQLYVNSGKLQAVLGKNTGTTAGLDYSIVAGPTNVADNAWHYVVLAYQNNYVQIYLDGRLEAAGYSVAPAFAATSYIRMGCTNDAGSDANFLTGQIDDLFFHGSQALGEEWVRARYRLGAAQGTASYSVVKYAIVTEVGPYAAGATLVTVYLGTDHTLANSAISSPCYSGLKVPPGFPSNPDKWTVKLQDANNLLQTSPVTGTYYNLNNLAVALPIGAWRVSLTCVPRPALTSGTLVQQAVTLSTSPTAGTDNEFYLFVTMQTPTGSIFMYNTLLSQEKILLLAAKTTYYVITVATLAATSISLRGDITPTTVRAICAYL